MSGDGFDTAALRAAVLAAWSSSPTRFREDANAEEDLRLGGYAGAWFVELAQNAADAAVHGGRLRVVIDGGELRVANTGAPLDAAGVTALASLRASAKRDDAGAVGRFGVGFAAVLPVSAEPRVVSTTGAVAFSAARTAEAVAGLPGPAAELARRDEPPVLRLVWPVDEAPPAGYTTEVRLPLRAGVDADALLAHARAAAPDLLLALPGLVEIDVAGSPVRREDTPGGVTIGGRRWRTVRRSGELPVVDEASEQRDRRAWSVTWALPLDAPLGDDVAHAPTATAEALALPARLIATLPLEPDRRRVRPGPATDAVVRAAADAYVDLVLATPPAQRLALVPEPGFPRSSLDAALHDALRSALSTTSWLPRPAAPNAPRTSTLSATWTHMAAEPPPGAAICVHVAGGAGGGGAGGGELVPGFAEWLDVPGVDDALPALLAAAGFEQLAAPPYLSGALTALGATRLSAATVVERLFGIAQPIAWWAALYDELAGLADTVPGLLDDLRALPVPLADGRTAAGPATVLLPTGEPLPALPGLPVAALAHPLLARLGAGAAEPATLLEALTDAVDRSLDDADAGLDVAPLAGAVLALVERAPRAVPALALPAADGGYARADELVLPDGALAPLLADDSPLAVLDPAFAARFPRAVLTAAGVLDGFALVVDEEPLGPDHDLDDEDRWWDTLDEPPARLVAVRDLDLVADDAWPAALALLASDRPTREPGYTTWWLSRHARLGGRRPGHWRLATATGIAPLYDAVPASGPDDAFLTAIGVRADLRIADARAADDLLARLADPDRHVDAELAAQAHIALADAVSAGRVDAKDLDLPEYVRALDGTVAHVDVAAVLDAPWPAAVLAPGELVIGGDPLALAELLDLPPATEIVAGEVEGAGTPVAWSALGEVVVACHTLGVAVPDGGLRVHDELWVRLTRPEQGRHRVPVWRDGGGGWHAADPLRALVSLLACYTEA